MYFWNLRILIFSSIHGIVLDESRFLILSLSYTSSFLDAFFFLVEVIALLGQGTFGKVISAYDHYRKEQVAIKIIKAIQKYRQASEIEVKVLNELRRRDPTNR